MAATLGLFASYPSEAATTTVGAKFEPPDGSLLSGVAADQQAGDTVETAKAKWDDWTRLMGGKRTSISHTFEGFDAWFGYDYDVANARGAMPLISWQTGSTAPKTIAQAGNTSSGKPTDQIILQNAKLSADYGKPVFLRVDQEMNAHWFPWSSYDADGSRRASGPEDFRNMWRRMAVVFDGGRVGDVNARLAALGLPPLDADARFPSWMDMPSTADPDAYIEPATNVAFVFNPADAPGIPDVSGNRWLDYYPGDAYVDWVGQTSYNATWNATMEQRFKWLSAFYEEFSVKRGKPYMMGEWGLEPRANSGFGDNPGYINDMLRWAKAHPKVKALVYFSVNESKGDYRLSSYPDSAKTLASALKSDGYFDTTVDTTGPAAEAPAQSFPETSTLGTSVVPVKLAWSATDDTGGSGIASYVLQQSVNGGAYSNVTLPSATTTTITPSLRPTYTYRYRVAAKDKAGNVSDWAYGPSFKVNAYQENATAVTYPSGTWTRAYLSGAFGSYVKYAKNPGATAKLSFTGRDVAWVAPKSSTRGKAEVYVDGAYVQTVDLYSSTMLARRVVFSKGWATSGGHTLEVRVLGTSGRPTVDVDAFVVLQ